ncbi:MAG: MFS transporter [Elusimicrobiales bacterium]|nr:MFS transporter [Elusimicrobiales bacterium]
MSDLLDRWRRADPAFKAFLLGVFFLGINSGVISNAFNNYLNDTLSLTEKQRGFLEFPRELPGFLLIFMTGLLAALPVRHWAVITSLLTAVGVAGLAFLSPGYNSMLVWMLLWSTGGHLFMTVESVMGLRFAKEGGHGRRLGQISGMTNFAAIAGAGFVWAMAKVAGPALYKWSFGAAALASLASAFLFARMKKGGEEGAPGGRRFVFRWKYKWYYLLNILFGARKQIFLTFAPWVLVTQYGASPAVMAALGMAAAGLGVVFRQAFGALTDRIGERRMFLADSLILLFICAGFAFATVRPLLYAIFILDSLMFATRIARTTYLNRIAEEKSHIAPTVSFGVTIDHAVSMAVPAAGGLLWAAYGYRSVFLAASLLAVAGFLAALAVDDGKKKNTPPLPAPLAAD